MKKSISIILMLMLVLSFTGCKNYSQKEITKFIEDYKKTQYTVDDYIRLDSSYEDADALNELCKPYFTQEGFKSFTGLRLVSGTIKVAIYQKCNIHVDKIDLKLYVDESKDGTLVYDYTAYLKLTSPETNKEKVITNYGQILLKKQNKTWKIESDIPGRLELPKDFTF